MSFPFFGHGYYSDSLRQSHLTEMLQTPSISILAGRSGEISRLVQHAVSSRVKVMHLLGVDLCAQTVSLRRF